VKQDLFLDLVADPQQASAFHAEDLEAITARYPFFQAAHLLLAKATGSADQLKTAAVRTADRSLLMAHFNGGFDPNANLPQIEEQDEVQTDEVNAFDKFDDNAVNDTDEVHTAFDDADDTAMPDFSQEKEEDEEVYSALEEDGDMGAASDDREAGSLNLVSEMRNTDPPLPEEKEQYTEDTDSPATPNFLEEEQSPLGDDFSGELMESLRRLQETREKLFIDKDGIPVPDWPQNQFKDEEFLHIEPELPDYPEAEEPGFTSHQQAEHPDEPADAPDNAPQGAASAPQPEQTSGATAQDKTSEAHAEQNAWPKSPSDRFTPGQPTSNTVNFPISNKSYFDSIEQDEQAEEDYVEDNLFELNDMLEDHNPSFLERNNQLDLDPVKRQKSLIDNFIKASPNISAKADEQRQPSIDAESLYNKSISADVGMMTETMAKIMYEQGKVGKAIEIYENLMLNNPDRKVYFASLIEKLKQD